MVPMGVRAFLSYARKNPRSKDTLAAIGDALSARGWERPFTDEGSVQPGDQWRRRLLVGLAETHAGIVLLTPEALASPWVLQELIVMSFRCDLDPQYRFVPVLLDGLTPEELAKHPFSPVALSHVQQVTGEPKDIAMQVAAALGDAATFAGSDTLLGQLAIELEKSLAQLTSAELHTVGGQLNVTVSHEAQGRRDIARSIARRALASGGDGIVSAIQAVAQHLRQKQTERLLELIAPLWISLEATARLKPVFNDVAVPALNGNHLPHFTAQCFLDRAYWPNLKQPMLVSVAGGSDGTAMDPIEQILNGVRMKLHFLKTQQQAQEFLVKRPDLVVILLPDPPPDDELLSELRSALPGVRFLASVTGAPTKSTAAYESMPAIDLDDETNAYEQVGFASVHAAQFP
jgi:hypothetical protein